MSVLNAARFVSRLHAPWYSIKYRRCFTPSVLESTSLSRFLGLQICTGGRVLCAKNLSTAPSTELTVEPRAELELVCPICYRPLHSSGSWDLNLLTFQGSSFACQNCRKTFESDGGIIDLTIPSDGGVPFGSSFFQIPLIAFVYERGYREAFRIFSFPGFDEEAKMAQKLLEPACGDIVMDLSCGPGAFTRRFLRSGDYKMVIAADFSQAMLEQCRGFLKNDASVDLSKVVLVRADAARLPFATSSMAGVHAAAAIHCWPHVMTSVAEISRVLQPGGVFVCSTFILPTPPGLEEPLKPVRQALERTQLSVAWFTEAELRATTEACGLINWYSYRKGIYILFSASKPLL